MSPGIQLAWMKGTPVSQTTREITRNRIMSSRL